MSNEILTGNIGALLRPGIDRMFGDAVVQLPKIYPRFMEVMSSDKNFERHLGLYGIGPAVATPEGTAGNYDHVGTGFTKDYVHVDYTNGYKISKNALDDMLYDDLIKLAPKELARSMIRAIELQAANILNRAFNSSYTGADGVQLCSTSHVRMRDASTYANTRSGNIPVSEVAVEQLAIDIAKTKDDAGNFGVYKPIQFIIPPELEYEVRRIMHSDRRAGTSDNDLNALKALGVLQSDPVVDPYMSASSGTQYFIQTDCERGLQLLMRKEPKIEDNLEFDNRVMKVLAHMRLSLGWDDPRAVFGNAGA